MEVESIEEALVADVEGCQSLDDLEKVRIKYLGRKGTITSLLKAVGEQPPEKRPELGARANRLKEKLRRLLEEKKAVLERARSVRSRGLLPPDPTLPAHPPVVGHRHVLCQVLKEMKRIFYGLGYSLAQGPDVELEYYNFEALNFPPDHPSRDLQDTFYLSDDILLRTQTSPVQVRYMESHNPPLKIIAPGRVYRNESVDQSHAAEFFQVEGLYVDTDVSMADLKMDVEIFVRELFGPKTKVRFRPHFFPFTEPSAEVDMSCFACGGSGCPVCDRVGWLEIMGAGMVHPNVFRAVGYDPEQYTGFAFGIGVDRVVMLKYGIKDIRHFLTNDLRFLRQF